MIDLPALPRRRWSTDAHDGITALVRKRAGQRSIAALDWDETCVRGDISYALLDDLDRESPDDLWAYYGGLVETDRLTAYKELAVMLLKGRTAEGAAAWTQGVYDAAVASGKLALVPEMIDLVAYLHAAEWDVWVVTGSPTAVVSTLSPAIGIPSERVIGMDPIIDEDGRFGASLIEPVTWREGKAELFKRRTGLAPALAIGDSEGDIQLLRSSERAVWVDRGDLELEAAALDHDWWRQEGWQ